MRKVLIVFGSKSDKPVYSQASAELKKLGIEHDVKVASAHRTPDDVEELSKKDYSIFIAGAGLAAALPGVIASRTIRPVIGVPVGSNYSGLDSFLSIAQMPPGIPVAAVGVDQGALAARQAAKMLKSYSGISLIGDPAGKAAIRAKAILDQFDISAGFTSAPDPEKVNISFACFNEPLAQEEALTIFCPIPLDQDNTAQAALNMLKHSTHGIWVGLSRGENAALLAIQVLNIDGRYTDALNSYRGDLIKKSRETSQNAA